MSGLRSSSELSVIVYGGVMRPASIDCCLAMLMLIPVDGGGGGSSGAMTDEGLICGGGSPTGQPSCDATDGRIVAALNMSCCCCSSQRLVGSIPLEEANMGPAPQPEFKSQSTLPISGRVSDCDLVWLLLLLLLVPLLRDLEIIDAPPLVVVPFWLVDVESPRVPPLPPTSPAPPGDDARPSR